ncbi:hypothetical protein C8Q77DRAFT_1220174 [Trametes polyzona]|nr:hypothetical protein C8Q77DRAFT_1220174 [Trametes polyzona]
MPPKAPEATLREAEVTANAELAKDYDRAFGHYIQAAEQFLSLSRRAPEGPLRTKYQSQAGKALERAEKIKSVRRNIKPAAKDEFAESISGEQLYVLQKGSLVDQGFFPLWDSLEQPTSSSQQPPLSSEQREHGAAWSRPDPERHRIYSEDLTDLQPCDIKQHVVSDCSVCGAVAVCIDHRRRFGSKMIASALYPQDPGGSPRWSDSGQYQFRILYNGAYRRIDDQLPSHPDGSLMCMSTGRKKHLWPSLAEKAYMKLAGGYDFIGSALAGWIPEHVDIRSSDFQPEKTWHRIAQGYHNGDCVLTLGTGERIPRTDIAIRLLPAHCYAVIGVSDDERRTLTVYDPWVPPGGESEPGASGHRHVLEISWDEACNLFDGIYLSWNPKLFKHQLTFHGYLALPYFDAGSHFRGQIKAETDTKLGEEEVVWLQLTRHVLSHRSNAEYISLSTQSGSGVGSSGGRDVLSTKVRASLPPDEILTLVASYEGEREDVGFTITAYTNTKASWVHTPAKATYSRDIEGAFTQKSAGGNHTYPSYYLNPQYHLRIHPRTGGPQRSVRDLKTDLSISLRGDRQIPMNATLAWSQGERINELGHNDLALSSGPYSYGHAFASGRVTLMVAGDYTLVVSAFEPRHIGKFDLRVECSDRFDITPILQEGAGMFSKVIKGEWAGDRAAGGPSFGNFSANPAFEIHVPSVSQLRFRLQLARSHPTASLNLTIFPASSSAVSGSHIATSGPYSDATSGVVIPQTTFQPGRYLAIPSTYHPGIQTGFVLIVYSTASGVQVVPVNR